VSARLSDRRQRETSDSSRAPRRLSPGPVLPTCRPWAPALGVIAAFALMTQIPALNKPAEPLPSTEVRLNVRLWQADSYADARADYVTDSLLALLEPPQP
jgi:hypothetical protein